MTTPEIPRTRAEAQRDLPGWEQRVLVAWEAYQTARRDLELARGELAIVQDVARGEFEPDYAVGSSGSWKVAS
jgi:hypothetical protein